MAWRASAPTAANDTQPPDTASSFSWSDLATPVIVHLRRLSRNEAQRVYRPPGPAAAPRKEEIHARSWDFWAEWGTPGQKWGDSCPERGLLRKDRVLRDRDGATQDRSKAMRDRDGVSQDGDRTLQDGNEVSEDGDRSSQDRNVAF